ncbi:MAG: AAA family ATPase [Proteobacteria bacterium]|nr:AAA family ATPase [Pseudomonadota bacterium]
MTTNATSHSEPTSATAVGGVVLHPSKGKVIAITSGKGGVGKTFLSANLAAALTRRGLRVLVLDADLGLANLDVVLNLYPKLTLHDVFTGRCTLDEAIVKAPGGFSVLLAGSGMVEYSRLTPEVLEDTVATLGVLLAASGILLTAFTGNPYWDIGFSAVIAVLLGLTAFFLGAVNMRYLADVRDTGAEATFVDIVAHHAEVEPPQLTVFNDATHLDESVVHFGPEGNLVTLFRHGQTEGNLLGRWQGHTDSPLTDLGKQQASAVAAHAPVMGQLYTSPLGRRQTAELLGRPLGLDPRPDEGFKEMSFGTWENLTSDEARVVQPGLYEQIYEFGNDLPRGGDGETFTGAGERMAGTVRSVVTGADSDIGVVSHGAVIRAYIVNIMELGFARRNTFPVPRNTSMTSVLYGDSHPILTSYNVAPHLEL